MTLYWFAFGVATALAGVILTLVWLDTPTRAERDREQARAEDSLPTRLDAADGLPIERARADRRVTS